MVSFAIKARHARHITDIGGLFFTAMTPRIFYGGAHTLFFVAVADSRHTHLCLVTGVASMRVLRKWPQLLPRPCSSVYHRMIFGLASKQKISETDSSPKSKKPILEQDNLFHPLSRSPFPALRARAEAVKSMAPCPVCLEEHGERRLVQFDCPDCGWPTHDSAMHWDSDKQHSKYCSRLRETNEDEHDLRSGRRIWEFDLPGSRLHCIYASFMQAPYLLRV